MKGTYNLYQITLSIFNDYSLIAVNGLQAFEKKFGITGHKRPPTPAETTRTRPTTTMMVNCITKRGAHLA